MRKFIVCKILIGALILVSCEASAGILKKGKYYTLWFNKYCRDGSTGMQYLNQWWCPTYKAKVSWSIPSTRENGAPLQQSELSGYEVYWGRSIDSRTGIIKVRKGNVSSVTFEVQTPATYYFVVSAIDSKGRKSQLSEMVETRLGK
jgi:hypothetical protein